MDARGTRRLVRPQMLVVAAALFGATPSAFGSLSFNAYFDATIGGNAAMVNTINNTLGIYSGLFTNNVTVRIFFQNGGGVGSSNTTFYTSAFNGAGGVCNKLAASATSADDTAGVASTGSCAGNNPVNNTSNLDFSSANGRVLGFAAPGTLSAIDGLSINRTQLDSIITLNTSIMNITRPPGNVNFYDMQAVVLHEVDEVLGTVSGLNSLGFPTTADLFRYTAAPGVRSYTTAGNAFFSINGSTDLVQYNNVPNCNQTAGDCGDWAVTGLRVQNWQGTAGTTPNLAEEIRLLDVVGYTLAQGVPEPGTMALIGLGLVALAGVRRRNSGARQ